MTDRKPDIITAFQTIADWCNATDCKKCPALHACENNTIPGDTMANISDDFIKAIGEQK